MAVSPSNRNRLVKAMWSVTGSAIDIVLPGVIAPDSHVEFVFHLGEPSRQQRVDQSHWRNQPRAFVLPMSHGALRLDGAGYASIVAFRVSPVVATGILGRPLNELWNDLVTLRELIGCEADALLDALVDSTPDGRFEVLHRWVERRLSHWDSGQLRAHRLFERVMWSAPASRVPALAKELGWSERGLRRVLVRETGLSPKEIQLAGRHLEACALLREQPTLEITGVAGQVGFFDHAAFTHSFRERLGMTPSQFRGESFAHYERRR